MRCVFVAIAGVIAATWWLTRPGLKMPEYPYDYWRGNGE